MPRVITTARLRLRALTLRDAPTFRALYCDPNVMRHIGKPMTPHFARTCLSATVEAARKPGGPRFFVIAGREVRQSVGLCSIRPVPPPDARVELGLMLLRQARGQGFAREALAALIDFAFRALPIDAVWVQYRHANAKAGRLCDDVGLPAPGRGGNNANRGQCVRVLRRPEWRQWFQKRPRGTNMQDVIGLLEQTGANAALRHASRGQLLQALDLDCAIVAASGASEKMYCLVFPAKAPRKAPTKKKPAKAPPKKKPAKKVPAKRKTPAKRKR